MPRSWALLALTLLLVAGFGAIVAAVYRRGGAEEGERPKHRMLEDD